VVPAAAAVAGQGQARHLHRLQQLQLLVAALAQLLLLLLLELGTPCPLPLLVWRLLLLLLLLKPARPAARPGRALAAPLTPSLRLVWAQAGGMGMAPLLAVAMQAATPLVLLLLGGLRLCREHAGSRRKVTPC
jgi:hypothetical protein